MKIGMNILLAILIVGITTSCSSMKKKGPQNQGATSANVESENKDVETTAKANELTAGWPDSSAYAAKATIQKYGDPHEVTSETLIWRNVAPFKRIIVHKSVYSDKFPLLHQNAIEHVVDYKVKPEKVDDIWNFDGSVVLSRTRGEMSATGQSEAMNILALNLAHEIITGRRSADNARIQFGKETLDYMNGKAKPLTQALAFGTQLETADAGETIANKIVWKGDQPSSTQKQPSRQAQEAKKQ